MKIIESKTEGKSPGRLSEDILVIMPGFHCSDRWSDTKV